MLQPIQVSERELEEFIVENPNAIEEGFRILSRQWPTDSGPLDILGADAEGTIVIIELKAKEDDMQLIQGLRYYDYISSNITAIAKYFSSPDFPISDQDLRLILIAPSFSRNLRRVSNYIDVELELKEYKAYKLPSGERCIVFSTVEIEEGRRPRLYPPLEDKLNNIKDEKIRTLVIRFLKDLEEHGFEKKMVHDEWISLWFGGKRIAALGCKRKFFVVETETDEGWRRFRINSEMDCSEILTMLKDKIKGKATPSEIG
jgi:Holliday junction resolvase-like predicted endonuclease